MGALPKDIYKRGKMLHYRFCLNTIEYRGSLRTDDPSTAKLVLAEVKKQIVLGTYGIKKMPLFSTVAESYMKDVEAKLSAETYRSSKTYLGIHIIPALGHYTLDKVTSEVVNNFIIKYISNHSNGSANNVFKWIALVYKYAINMGYIKDKPYKVKRFKVTVEPKTLLEIDNVYNYIDYCYDNLKGNKYEHNQTAVMIAVAALTGMRSGEIIASRWEWLNEAERKLTVRANKTGTVRVIPISQYLVDKLVEYRNASGLSLGLMFPGKDGKQRCSTTLYRVIVNMAEALNLAGKFGPHSCRHSFITIQHDLQTPLGDISKIVGHSNLATTAKYIHPSFRGQKAAQDRMAEAASLHRTKTGTDGK